MDTVFTLQESIIATQLRNLETARAALPPLEQPHWRDDASVAYAMQLLLVHHQADAILAQLRGALSEARRAAETVAAR